MALRESLVKLRRLLCTLSQESREGLLQISGLGAGKVDKILQERESRGGSLDIGGLMEVPGIGVNLLARIVEDPTAATVVKYAQYYQEVVGGDSKHPKDVVSMDIGLYNSAFVHLDGNLNLLDWKKFSLGMPKPYSLEKCYEQVKTSLNELPVADVYLLEAQSHRIVNPRAGFLGISVQMRALEAMVFAVMKQEMPATVYVIQPRRVSEYFGISRSRSRGKKQAAIYMTWELLSTGSLCTMTPLGNNVSASKELAEYFDEEKKRDDLSDCLLQAIAFLEWSEMARELA